MNTGDRANEQNNTRHRDRVGTTRIVAPIQRFDQRDTVFSKVWRGELGEKMKENAYAPSGDPLQRIFNYPTFKENALVNHLINATDGPVNSTVYEVKDPAWMAERVKTIARYLGADLVGITELDQAFVYTHRGGKNDIATGEYGKEITLTHRYAISIARSMDIDKIKTSPSFISGAEAGIRYYDIAVIVCELAAYIRELGYSARGHHIRREDVLHVPIAVDAGLGELGRNGFLLTKEYGPRVRLGTVTTDLPMAVDSPVNIGAQEFCTICKKCATCCPSQSIPHGEKEVVRGVEKWQIDPVTCRKYWSANRAKWDSCISCIKTCPWNKPLTWWHLASVEAVRRSSIAGKLLLWLDDLMYGKNPQYKELKAKLKKKYLEYP